MTEINQLPSLDTPVNADLLVAWSSAQGGARKLSITALEALLATEIAAIDNKITQYSAPSVSGFSLAIIDNNSQSVFLILTPTVGLLLGNIILPPASTSEDKREVLVVCTKPISQLSLTCVGASIVGAPSSLDYNSAFRMRYDLLTNTWYKVELSSSALTTVMNFLSNSSLDTSTAAGHTTNTVTNTGANYAVNDLLYLVGGTYTVQASMKVTGVDGSGKPNAIVVNNPGVYSALPSSPTSTTTNSAFGTGTITLAPVWISSLSGIPQDMSNTASKLGLIPGSTTVANGGVDNFAQLQLAINQSHAAGLDYIYFDNSYNFIIPANSSIQLPPNFKLWSLPGLGKTLYIDPATWTGIGSGVTLTFIKYQSGCSIIGLTFDGQKALTNSGNPTIYGLSFLGRTNQTDSDVLFMDLICQNQLSGASALECFCIASGYSSQRLKFVRVDCRNNNGTGISINGDMPTFVSSGGASGMPTEIDVIDCQGRNNLWQGITFYVSGTARVVNFTGENNGSAAVFGGSGLNIEWSTNISILGGTFKNNNGPGIGGFGWNDQIYIRGADISNNNLGDYSDQAEICFKRGSFYTSGFAAASRSNYYGVIQQLTIDPSCNVNPKTTGNYKNHIHISHDCMASYPSSSSTKAGPIRIRVPNVETWRASSSSADVYSYAASVNGATWMPASAISLNNTRHNGGYLLTCTTAGTTAAWGTLGPQPTTVGQTGITDGSVVWTATSLSVDQINQGAQWAQSTSYVWNDVRCNNGYAYRVTVPSAFGVLATSGTGNGPQGTTLGGTETDGGVTWQCLGRVQSSSITLGSQVPKVNDAWPSGVFIDATYPSVPAVNTPLSTWTASSLTLAAYTGGDDFGEAALITATAAGTTNSGTNNIQDTKYLPAGNYIAVVRYRNITGDTGFHLAMRPVGVWTLGSGNGDFQFDLQLASVFNDTTSWIQSQFAFTIPATTTFAPIVYYSGNNAAAQIAVDVKILPIRDINYRSNEISLGGKRLVYSGTPTNMDFDLGDRLMSATQAAPDQVCTTAGSFGAVLTATITAGTSTTAATLSVADPSVRPGLWVNIPGAGVGGVSALKRIRYVSGTSVILSSSTAASSTVTNSVMTVQAPVFTQLAAGVPLPTCATGLVAHSTGGQASATALTAAWNSVTTVAAVGDSMQMDVLATPGVEREIVNNGGNSLNLFPKNGGSDKFNLLAANASIALGSGSNFVIRCVVAGQWLTK